MDCPNVLPYEWAQSGYPYPLPGAGGRLKYLGFHSCSECDPIRGLKNRGVDGQYHSQLPKNLLFPPINFQDPLLLIQVPSAQRFKKGCSAGAPNWGAA